jgi:hypothetical protein
MIDTVSLTSKTAVSEDHPEYFQKLPLMPKTYDQPQWDWIEAQLAASTADYLIVAGHYPVYSVCEHGNTPTLVTSLQPLLEQHGAHYLSGHDHCMEHIVESDVNYILSGMGKECCYAASNIEEVPKGATQWYIASNNAGHITGGFSSMTATSSGLSFVYYDQTGSSVYTTPSIKPRN